MLSARARLSLTCLLIISVLVIALVASGCGNKGATSSPPAGGSATSGQGSPKVNINFLAANPGGEWYPLAVAIGDIWQRNISGLTVTVKPGGGVSNVFGVSQKLGEVGLTHSAMAVQGVNGGYPYDKAYPDVEALAVLYPTAEQIVVWADSGITRVEDLKGKRINVYTKGYASEAVARMILNAYGLDYSDMSQVMYLNDDDAIDGMKDGHLDATLSMGSVPDAGFVDLSSQRPIRVLPIDDAHLEALKKMNAGLVRRVVPAGSYNGIDKDVPTVGTSLIIAVNKNVSEELVYSMAKFLAENLDKLYNVTEAMKTVRPQDLAGEAGIPFHKGAEKYYKEQGWLK